MWILDEPYKFGAEEMLYTFYLLEYNLMMQDLNLFHYDTIRSVNLLKNYIHIQKQTWKTLLEINPLAYTDVPETAGLARSINP